MKVYEPVTKAVKMNKPLITFQTPPKEAVMKGGWRVQAAQDRQPRLQGPVEGTTNQPGGDALRLRRLVLARNVDVPRLHRPKDA